VWTGIATAISRPLRTISRGTQKVIAGTRVHALKLGLRAYRDFYDQIWWLLLLLVLWWLLNVTVVFGPAATLLLFHEADPRQGIWEDRLGPRGSVQFLIQNFARGWKLALMTLPAVALVAFNLNYYGHADGALGALSPIWFLLLIVFAIATCVIFAVAAVTGEDATTAWKSGARITLVRMPALVMLILITAIVPAMILTSVLIFAYPLFFVIPGLVATALSRYALTALKLQAPSPNQPTEERLREKKSG
jgi:hypothetical protein